MIKNNSTMRKVDEYSIAIHEAGHAVMSVIYKRNLESVTIIPSDGALGFCRSGNEVPIENETDEAKGFNVLREVLILLAGTTAESVLLGTNPLQTRGKADFDKANEIFDLPNDGRGRERSNSATKIAWDLFRTPKAQQQIKAVASALMEYKTLTGVQVREIMKV